MKVEIIQTSEISAFVGIRVNSYMTDLGDDVIRASNELRRRRDEIKEIKNQAVTYGISPPNYKENNDKLDFYCCYEVNPLANLPHGMIHIHLLPRTYSITHYQGPRSKIVTAYDYTSKWLKDNGYEYDDTSYYFEKYEERTSIEPDEENNEIKIFCPVKKSSK